MSTAPTVTQPRPHTHGGRPLRYERLILLIEDDVEMRRLMTRALERDGYEVVALADGEEALEWLGLCLFDGSLQRIPALIVSDLRLPDFSGLELLESLLAATDEIPVIVVTGFPSQETYAEAFELGAARVLEKPFDLDTLRLAVFTTLDARRSLPTFGWRQRRSGWTQGAA